MNDTRHTASAAAPEQCRCNSDMQERNPDCPVHGTRMVYEHAPHPDRPHQFAGMPTDYCLLCGVNRDALTDEERLP